MWFRSVFLKTLRDYRIAILGWGLGIGPGHRLAWPASPCSCEHRRRAPPWSTWRLLRVVRRCRSRPTRPAATRPAARHLILLIAVWPLLAASRMLRGEEEPLLARRPAFAPRGRVRVAVEKLAAMWTALLLMGVLVAILAYLGGLAFKGDFGLGDTLLFGLDLALICGVLGHRPLHLPVHRMSAAPRRAGPPGCC